MSLQNGVLKICLAGIRFANGIYVRIDHPKRALFMWDRKLVLIGIVVFVLVIATLVVAIAVTGGLYLIHEL